MNRLLTTKEWEELRREWEAGKHFGYCWEDLLTEKQDKKTYEQAQKDVGEEMKGIATWQQFQYFMEDLLQGRKP